MSKLQELIKKLCPDGVEFRKLGEVCEIKRGVRVVKNDLINDGKYPVFQNSLIPLGYYEKNNYPANITFVISAGAAGEIGYTEEPIWAADDCLTIISPNNIINKFIYYCLIANKLFFVSKVRRASVPRLSRTVVDNFEIPIPPLEVQNEIVRILDTFTAHTAELQAELQARKEQYEYYRNKLLTFDENDERVKWIKLGEIGNTCMCKRIMKHQTSDIGEVPFFKIGTFGKEADAFISYELYDEYKNKYSFPRKGEILISASGTIGRTVIYDGQDAYFQDSNIIWIQNDESKVLNKYLYYYYQIIEWNVEGGTIKRLYNTNLSKTIIAYPPLSEQQRIISILDKFESLVNDLSEGLPAEIAAVQEQYEYYRNKLLTFKRKS
ncbi:restriction endonuclease subunit S [Phocaeicola plebeius]